MGLKKQYTINHLHVETPWTVPETTLAELIEEDKGTRWKHRKLKRRLISYNNHLQQTMMYSSAVLYLSTVKSFYRYFEIEIHTLSGLNKKNSNLPVQIRFKDLPDKEVIRQFLEITTPLLQSAILFMVSSGCSGKETLTLTIQDYLDNVKEYTKGINFQDTLRFLVEKESEKLHETIKCFKGNKHES